jgi:alpha-amylase/alpha-mannosidase (GH57 family)
MGEQINKRLRNPFLCCHSEGATRGALLAEKKISSDTQIETTATEEYLEKYPPSYEVEIMKNTSWSCSHGVERWRDDCGCGSTDGHNQQWRRPLRNALDWLRHNAADVYEKELGRLFHDPWKVRDNYIDIIQDRSPENLEIFIDRHAWKSTGHADRVRILKLLEMQRHAMLIYTSCGCFFNDLSRIETVQIIQYAGRLLQLCDEMTDQDIASSG